MLEKEGGGELKKVHRFPNTANVLHGLDAEVAQIVLERQTRRIVDANEFWKSWQREF